MRTTYKSLLMGVTAIAIVTGFQQADIPPQPRAVAQTDHIRQVSKKVEKPSESTKNKKVVKHATPKKKASTKPLVQPRAIPKPIPASNSGDVVSIITKAAVKYGIDPARAIRIANCESGYNPNAVNYNYNENGYPSGLYQHISGYWSARAEKYGYAGASVFDPVANANVTMAMWAEGLSHLWECS